MNKQPEDGIRSNIDVKDLSILRYAQRVTQVELINEDLERRLTDALTALQDMHDRFVQPLINEYGADWQAHAPQPTTAEPAATGTTRPHTGGRRMTVPDGASVSPETSLLTPDPSAGAMPSGPFQGTPNGRSRRKAK